MSQNRLLAFVLALTALCGTVPQPMIAQAGVIAGQVLAERSERPIVDARIELRSRSLATRSDTSEQFAPSDASFMVNYRVDDLHALVAALKAEGCTVLDRIDDSEYGKFAWVIDPEGNKVELWEPAAG